MDALPVLVISVIAIFAAVAVGVFLVYRQRSKVKIKGPYGLGMELEGSNEEFLSRPGMRIEEAKSNHGGLLAENSMGDGVEIKRVEVKDDIIVTNQRAVRNSAADKANLAEQDIPKD